MINIQGSDFLNYAEATIGTPTIDNQTIVIPTANLHIDAETQNKYLQTKIGHYLDFCYVRLFNVKTITWDYEVSRSMAANEVICIGGEIFKGDHTEFWVEYSGAEMLIPKCAQFSKQMLHLDPSDPNISDFFLHKHI